eukprot:CAMPEP_0198294164 /NCGR_PEP_ID=MMETSP1449-20131203/21187_1 /TAXON_ID=420275 /ORGANISM="Attheya septentrionalis, Strain CCMP2084" /LENGTH=231 /DNA_ID=CAMNT_0043994041 /DNA_START=124 /DNA_END=816 /DNA_ORIENTATION=-
MVFLGSEQVEVCQGFAPFQAAPHLMGGRGMYRQTQQLLHSNNFFGDLWDEIIEVSTYGPSERKMLKARRNAKAEADAAARTGDPLSDDDMNNNDDDEWVDAFRAAKDDSSLLVGASSKDEDEFDGYALRDLLVGKWGVPLDVDFQRVSGATIYCTILPVIGFGTSKTRHNSEIEYLMHLQGIIEILDKYNQLDGFLDFIESTTKVPKQGTDSVPFRLQLTETQIQRILPNV